MINFNFISFMMSLVLILLYGQNDLKSIKRSGAYDVAARDLHLPGSGNALTVYYPMDKHHKQDNSCRWWLNYRRDDRIFNGLARAYRAIGKLSNPLPTQIWFSWKNHLIDVVSDAPLAQDFSDGKKKLVPVVFSHSYTLGRGFYSTSASELASNGFLVVTIDHHDGSCCYT